MRSKRSWANAPSRGIAVTAALVIFASAGSGCAETGRDLTRIPLQAVAAYSPPPEVVTPDEAITAATQLVRDHSGFSFLIGAGNSMAPLYRDQAVIVIEQRTMNHLHLGQTVVFMGEHGFPVAHVLIQHSDAGWLTQGVGNAEADRAPLTEINYIGLVVKVFQPTGSPILGLARSKAKPAVRPAAGLN